MTDAHDVVVIGAGFAGLSAAAALAERGRRVLVLEARGRLGGRATAHTDRETGEAVDNGQHVLLGCYHETLTFLRRIGAHGLLDLQEELEVPYVDAQGVATTLRCPRWPSPLHLLGGVFRWPALSLRDRLSVLRLAPVLLRARRFALGEQVAPQQLAHADETVERWLIRRGQSPRIRAMLWEPLALAALNQDIRSAAALPFVRVLGGVFGPGARDSAIGLPTIPLDEFYAEPARRFLEGAGSDVRVNALARIVTENARIARVEVRGAPIGASTVIAAVPWHDLPALCVGDTRAIDGVLTAAAGTAASPIVTVNLWCDRRIVDAPFVGLPGRVMQWVFEGRGRGAEGQGGTRGEGRRGREAGGHKGRGAEGQRGTGSRLSLVSSGADDVLRQSNEALIDLACRELREAFPAMRDAVVRSATVLREPRATFSIAPGQPARPATRTSVRGLYLAGDWVDTGLPATIESAVASGHRAAQAVMGNCQS